MADDIQLDYKVILRNELTKRITKNPAFSMRAFARELKLSSGYLSQILNSQRSLSVQQAHRISETLGWGFKKRELFLDLLSYSTSKDPATKSFLLKKLAKSHKHFDVSFNMSIDNFTVISEPYHFAIMEMTELDNFIFSPKNISDRLGIPLKQVRDGISRLLRVNLLVQSKDRFIKSSPEYGIRDIPSETIRTFHGAQLEKAKHALSEQPMEMRDFTSLTFAINPKKMNEARELIHKFNREMMDILQEGPKTKIYQLGIQLFQTEKYKIS